MIVSAIVAQAKNRVIGKNNDIPWYLPADLKYFKKTTIGKPVIMGRKCFESIGRALPKRTNIIITRDPFFLANDCLIAHSVYEALSIAAAEGHEEAFIIGGGEIYNLSMPYWDKLYLTEVDIEPQGDVFFPEINPSEWTLISEEAHLPDEKTPFFYKFLIFERKNPE
jgi:dihydrofolate reductase